jgi:hypothetical protein
VTVLKATADDADAGVGRLRAARRRVPRSLAVLLVVAVVEALAWMCVMPPLQGPDEVGHVAYTQKIVESGTVPWRAIGAAPAPGTRPVSREVEAALSEAAIKPSWGNPSGRPAATALEERSWDRLQHRITHDARADGGFTSSMANPPAYYLYEAIPYLAAYGGSVFDRALAMRLANLPLLVTLVVLCWLVAGELFGRSRWLQTLATAAVVLQPQVIHVTATVNPDIGLGAIWAAALLVMIRTVKHGLSRGRLAWLTLLVIASGLTQPRGVALAIPALAALAMGAWDHRLLATRRRRQLGAGALGLLGLIGLIVVVDYATADLSGSRVRQFASYVWQFYLPRLGFMTPSISPDWGVRQAFVDRLFGGYAQLEVGAPPAVLTVVAWAAAVVAVLAVIGAVVHRRAIAARPAVAAVCAVTVVGYLFVLHAAAYRSMLAYPDPVITGRYLLTLMPLYGAGIALAVAWMPRRVGVAVGAVVLVGLSVLQVQALALLFERFYA